MAKKYQTTESIADLMRRWRSLAQLDVDQAGEVLGLSGRTVEGVEGGRRADDKILRLAIERLIDTS